MAANPAALINYLHCGCSSWRIQCGGKLGRQMHHHLSMRRKKMARWAVLSFGEVRYNREFGTWIFLDADIISRPHQRAQGWKQVQIQYDEKKEIRTLSIRLSTKWIAK
jgi:hypothetical protein